MSTNGTWLTLLNTLHIMLKLLIITGKLVQITSTRFIIHFPFPPFTAVISKVFRAIPLSGLEIIMLHCWMTKLHQKIVSCLLPHLDDNTDKTQTFLHRRTTPECKNSCWMLRWFPLRLVRRKDLTASKRDENSSVRGRIWRITLWNLQLVK